MKDIFRLRFLSSKNQRDRLPSLSMTVPCWPRSGGRWRLQLTSATSRASAVLKGTRDIVWFNPFGSQLPKRTSFVEATSAPLVCGPGLRQYFREIKPPRSGKSELLCAVGKFCSRDSTQCKHRYFPSNSIAKSPSARNTAEETP